MSFVKKNLAWIIPVGIVGVLLICFLGALQARADTRSTAVHMETQLSAQYDNNRIELSNIKATFYSTISVANLKSDKMDQLIEDAVKGRYDGQSTAAGAAGKGTLFSAVVEAYPQLGENYALYDKIAQFLIDARKSYAQDQMKLRDMLRAYDLWRNDSGFLGLHPLWVSWAGVPTSNLKATVNGTVVTGQAAEDQMSKLVLTSDAQKSYDTGVDTPEQAPTH